MFGECQNNGGNSKKSRDPLVLNKTQNLLEIESGHGDDGDALGQQAIHEDLHAVDVEERQHRQGNLIVLHRQSTLDLAQIGDKIAVGEHHSLGQPRGSR